MTQEYNPQEMITAADELVKQKGLLQKEISNMRSIVEQMATVWQSDAQRAFTARFNEIDPQLSSFCTTIQSFADGAKNHAQAVIASETTV